HGPSVVGGELGAREEREEDVLVGRRGGAAQRRQEPRALGVAGRAGVGGGEERVEPRRRILGLVEDRAQLAPRPRARGVVGAVAIEQEQRLLHGGGGAVGLGHLVVAEDEDELLQALVEALLDLLGPDLARRGGGQGGGDEQRAKQRLGRQRPHRRA